MKHLKILGFESIFKQNRVVRGATSKTNSFIFKDVLSIIMIQDRLLLLREEKKMDSFKSK